VIKYTQKNFTAHYKHLQAAQNQLRLELLSVMMGGLMAGCLMFWYKFYCTSLASLHICICIIIIINIVLVVVVARFTALLSLRIVYD